MRINYNGLYYFHYKPTTNVHLYDKHPLIFVLDMNSRSILGVNIHWIPKHYREEFIEQVEDIMSQTIQIGQKRQRARLTYQLLKQSKYKIALQGIRRYIVSSITKIEPIPEKKWDKVLKKKKYKAKIIELNKHGIKENELSSWYLT